ncbi:MAG: hypothetical protein CBD97_04060 [Pelagibacteraceae bacterium TMED237]|nr:MAG: hypothetical protein CBD97_04060 [Pelagibacteraceae bacterium TMED237]
MIVNLNKIVLISLLFLGYYYFYYSYEKLIKLDYNYINKDILKNNLNTDNKKNNEIKKTQINIDNSLKKIDLELTKTVFKISKGDTFLSIIRNFNFEEKKVFEIINEIEKFFNLKELKVDDKINFYIDKNKQVKKIEIHVTIDTILIINIGKIITINEEKLAKIQYTTSKEFKISESLYSDGLKNDLPQNILIKLIKLFSFDLDFQRDIKKNTIVSVSYEFNQIKDTDKFEYKDINYALISIDNKEIEYFKFLTNEGYIDYFNRAGKNVKKSILKTPLDGARLSSNFGMRKHPISGYNKMHKGVDFAAPMGTPIYAGGNGVIEYAGNNGGYGKYIRIRHNNEYKTAYAHLSSFKKGISKGKRVNQGEVIGFVGSTGNSTGPHLHYEILYQNKQINPLKLKLPSGKILKGEEYERFKKEFKLIYANHLNLLYE